MANRKPVKQYPLRHDIPIDIAYTKIHPNIVSEYEAMEAAVFGHYNWEQFSKLTLDKQALCVAQYRVHNRVDMVVNQEVADYSKRHRAK